MNKNEVTELLAGTVDEIKPKLADLGNADLQKLHDAEEKGENRSTLLHAIDAARDDQTTSETASDFRTSHPVEFEQGRRARASGISRDDAPFDRSNPQFAGSVAQYDAWAAGYDSYDDNGAELRMQTASDNPTAANQTETVAEANKG